MHELTRVVTISLAVSVFLACSEEPAFTLREAVPSPNSSIAHGLFAMGAFPKFEQLWNCERCEKASFSLPSGEEVDLHVTPDVAYAIRRDQITSSILKEKYGFLSTSKSFYTLECVISTELLQNIFSQEEARGRGGLLIPFRDGRPLAYGTAATGPCYLGFFREMHEGLAFAKELDLRPQVLHLTKSEVDDLIPTSRKTEVRCDF